MAGLDRLNEKRDLAEGRADRRQKRGEVVEEASLLFSFGCLWKAELLVQAKKRGNASLSQKKTAEIRGWLKGHDTRYPPLETLQAEAEKRKLNPDRTRPQLLRTLRAFDKRAETKRHQSEKEQRKRKRETDEL